MHIVLGVVAIAGGLVLILGRRHVGPPPNMGRPLPGTPAYERWTARTQVGGVAVGIALIAAGIIYAIV